MRLIFLSIAVVAALASCGQAPAPPADLAAPAVEGAWLVDKAASRIAFTGTQNGKEFTGDFDRFEATILFDPADLAASRVEAVIDTGSAKTGDRQRDGALPGADWLSSSAFPTARFVSTSIEATGVDAYEAAGELSIRGAAKDLTLPFSLRIAGDRATADAVITLNRSDFGVGQGEEFVTDKWVGYEVQVTIHIEAVR